MEGYSFQPITRIPADTDQIEVRLAGAADTTGVGSIKDYAGADLANPFTVADVALGTGFGFKPTTAGVYDVVNVTTGEYLARSWWFEDETLRPSVEELAGITGQGVTAADPVAKISDLPGPELSADELAGIQAGAPTGADPVVTSGAMQAFASPVGHDHAGQYLANIDGITEATNYSNDMRNGGTLVVDASTHNVVRITADASPFTIQIDNLPGTTTIAKSITFYIEFLGGIPEIAWPISHGPVPDLSSGDPNGGAIVEFCQIRSHKFALAALVF